MRRWDAFHVGPPQHVQSDKRSTSAQAIVISGNEEQPLLLASSTMELARGYHELPYTST